MRTQTDLDVLNDIVALHLQINLWSARKKLTPEDFGDAELPPEQLASLGSKKICDPKELRIFGAIKSRAFAILDRIGVRFLGGWAIPKSRSDEALSALSELKMEFITAKQAFLNRYDEAIKEWIASNPGWENLIAGSLVSVDYVDRKLAFNWQMFFVGATKVSNDNGFDDEVQGLGDTLFSEIAKTASEVWNKSYAGKVEVNRRALSSIRTLYSKLHGLTFVEPRVAPVAELVETALTRVKGKGPVFGANLVLIRGLLTLLQNPGAMLEHGQKILEGQSANGFLDGFTDEEECETHDALPVDVPQLDSFGLW